MIQPITATARDAPFGVRAVARGLVCYRFK